MTDVTREIVICSTPRSGSTILAEAMYLTGRLGVPDEFFNNDQNNKGDRPHTIFEENYRRVGATSYADYCDKLARHWASDNGVHSVKMHFQHFRQALRSGYFDRVLPRSYVFIHRADVAAQAASLAIALKTQRWNSRMKSSVEGEVEIDETVLARCFHDLTFDNLRWQAFFRMFNMDPLVLEYEEIAADLAGAVERIAAHAGVELDHDKVADIASNLTGKKQSGDRNAKLKERLTGMTLENFGPGNILYDTDMLFPKTQAPAA